MNMSIHCENVHGILPAIFIIGAIVVSIAIMLLAARKKHIAKH